MPLEFALLFPLFFALLLAFLYLFWGLFMEAAWNFRYFKNRHRYVNVTATVTGEPPAGLPRLGSDPHESWKPTWIWVSFPFEGSTFKVRLHVTWEDALRAFNAREIGVRIDPQRPTDVVLD